MVAKPLYPLYKNIIKPLDRVRYPELRSILQSTGRPLLKGSGSISHEEAMDKAIAEYRKYQVKTLTPVEEAYLESINALGKIAKRKGRQSGENH